MSSKFVDPESGSVIAQGSVSALAVAFLHHTMTLMFPFLCVACVLIIVDLVFGVKAAKKRGEDVRLSRALRRTVNKVVEYACWIILSSSLAVAFNFDPLNWILLSVVITAELISVISNWYFLHGKKISGLEEFGLGLLKDKIGHDTSMIKIKKEEEKEEEKK